MFLPLIQPLRRGVQIGFIMPKELDISTSSPWGED